MLKFKGIQKTTLVDYPGEVACTFFTGGCNFSCSYCHNPELAKDGETSVNIDEDEALIFLRERKRFLDGVCISGGEPLMQPGLPGFLKKAKALGYKVKIDTNGAYPEALRRIIDEGLVDYVAMDIKAPLDRYEEVTNSRVEAAKIEESVRIIKRSGIDYEFRTTAFSGLSHADFDKIGGWLSGSRRYFIQPVKTRSKLLDELFAEKEVHFSPAALSEIADRMSNHFERVEVRG